jgi:hypothetical protein
MKYSIIKNLAVVSLLFKTYWHNFSAKVSERHFCNVNTKLSSWHTFPNEKLCFSNYHFFADFPLCNT